MSGFALHLLRHGAPERPGRLMGRTDDAPTAEGIAACVASAQGLATARLVTSDLQRARRAAEAIAPGLGLVPATDPRWRELDFGDWDGCDPATIDPGALARFHADPEHAPPPGGERWSQLTERMSAAIDALAPLPTLVVTHGGAMRAALHLLCGFDARQIWAFDLPCAALLSLRVWPGEKRFAQITGLRA
ncbi:MAG: histidine phosphatase family protein [Sphingomonas sp.]